MKEFLKKSHSKNFRSFDQFLKMANSSFLYFDGFQNKQSGFSLNTTNSLLKKAKHIYFLVSNRFFLTLIQYNFQLRLCSVCSGSRNIRICSQISFFFHINDTILWLTQHNIFIIVLYR